VNNGDCANGAECDTGIGRCVPAGSPSCTDYCTTIETNCTGQNAMYSSGTCLEVCAAFPLGSASDTGGNTLGCREYHAGAAAANAGVHCPHAGPSGDGQCGGTCESFCTLAQALCTGSNQQYASTGDCLAECAGFPATPKYNATTTSGDSYACRLYHLTAASVDPGTHCAHIVEASPVCN
jgi:hypothetical protein